MRLLSKIFNRPTNIGGSRTLIAVGLVNIVAILLSIYRPELLSADILVYIEAAVFLFIGVGAAQEEKPTTAQGITEHPPISRT